jgi:hypothetical protein
MKSMWRVIMYRSILILAAFAFTIVIFAITPIALSKGKCPDGAIWDQIAKKCVGDTSDDPEEGGEGSM